ncbi:MAG: PP2C family protein-serine/threonine phosphatase [Terracidiphilus sp.]|nr:PP2C family protein-serine/threonine phosphatase [Terracidiphilus sp.]MDR3799509.1 PP2C family protein-serine/threonine phosphatase [Terracidiphilus sp.]
MKKLLLVLLLALARLPGLAQLPASNDVVVLDAWRIHEGDDLTWARADFDDTKWSQTTSPARSSGLNILPGFHWYRTTVELPKQLEGRELAIGMGGIDEVYEVYVEGVSVGRFGRWEPKPESPFDRDLTFAIPPGLIKGSTVHIALRRWVGATTTGLFPFYTSGAERFGHTPEIGLLSTVSTRTALYQYRGVVANLPWNFCLLSMLAAGCIAFVLFSAQRNRVEYILLGIYCVGSALVSYTGGFLAASDSVMRRSWGPTLVFAGYMLVTLSSYLFLSQICLRFRRWILAVASLNAIVAAHAVYGFAFQAHWAGLWLFTIGSNLPIVISLLAALGLLLERKAGSVAIALSLLLVQLTGAWTNYFSHMFRMSDLRFMPVGPFSVDIRGISQTLFVFVTLIVLYLRFRDEQLHQAAFEQDMAAARNVQQYLIPEHLPATPGLTIQSEYRPAREVGGDFFQVLPKAADGSVLVVVGDVAGKGLHAGMLATLIVGAIRTAASFTNDPRQILALLNERMCGRGLATCLALRIGLDGDAVLANAGHLPPYFNGRELAIEGALPLGVVAGVEFPVLRFKLAEGDSLMLMTDGVAEAQDAVGQLFGFDRISEMLGKGTAAAALASAAQNFGQEDDITVLTVARMAAAV